MSDSIDVRWLTADSLDLFVPAHSRLVDVWRLLCDVTGQAWVPVPDRADRTRWMLRYEVTAEALVVVHPSDGLIRRGEYVNDRPLWLVVGVKGDRLVEVECSLDALLHSVVAVTNAVTAGTGLLSQEAMPMTA